MEQVSINSIQKLPASKSKNYILFSNLHEKSKIGCIERKIKFSIFLIFICRTMAIFVTSSPQFSKNFHDNLKKKSQNKMISFFILFSTFHISHKNKNLTISEGWGGGLHILGWDRAELRKFRIF